jgi:hypothetical protein
MTAPRPSWGPWSPGIDATERAARCRALAMALPPEQDPQPEISLLPTTPFDPAQALAQTLMGPGRPVDQGRSAEAERLARVLLQSRDGAPHREAPR